MRVIMIVLLLSVSACGIKGDPQPRTEGVACPFCE